MHQGVSFGSPRLPRPGPESSASPGDDDQSLSFCLFEPPLSFPLLNGIRVRVLPDQIFVSVS